MSRVACSCCCPLLCLGDDGGVAVEVQPWSMEGQSLELHEDEAAAEGEHDGGADMVPCCWSTVEVAMAPSSPCHCYCFGS